MTIADLLVSMYYVVFFAWDVNVLFEMLKGHEERWWHCNNEWNTASIA